MDMNALKPPVTWLDKYNTPQRRAIIYPLIPGSSVFILAAAGSGKTSVLTSRIAYLLSQGIDPLSVLALTFTDKAAQEMKDRVKSQTDKLHLGVSPPERMGTFHSFALGVIRENCLGQFNWRRLGFTERPGVKDPGEKQKDNFNNNSLSFDRMMPLVLELFRKYPEIAGYYAGLLKFILVDEFQDTSTDQLELCKYLTAAGASLFVVGDDDQAIYGFRGADENSIQQLFESYPAIDVIKLETNYRSTESIITYANTIFKKKSRLLQKHLRPGVSAGGNSFFSENLPVNIKVFYSSLAEGKWISNEIIRLHEQYQVPYSNMAILFRLNGHEYFYRNCFNDLLGKVVAEQIIFQTIHSSKGLQYPVVFLVGLESGTLPYFTRQGSLTPARSREERRLFYVGVTRAESLLTITGCKKRFYRGKYQSHKISPYLLESGNLKSRLKLRLKNFI